MREFAPLGATYAFNYGNEGSVSAGPHRRQELIISPRAVREDRLSARHVNHEPRPLIYDPLITFDTKNWYRWQHLTAGEIPTRDEEAGP